MLARRLLSLVLLPALLAACPEKDEPDTSGGDSSGSSGTVTTSDPTTGATTGDDDSTGQATAAGCVQSDCSAMCAGWHDEPCHTPYLGSCVDDECVCEAQPSDCEMPPPVECGMETCAEGQICVQPGLNCDYGQDPPEFFTPPPKCADVPAQCDGKLDAELQDCLGKEYCPEGPFDTPSYMDGQLTCPTVAADCF